MKIRITKNTMPLSWYRDMIGKTFDVIDTRNDLKHYVVHRGRLCDSFVRFDDCEIIKCKDTAEGNSA